MSINYLQFNIKDFTENNNILLNTILIFLVLEVILLLPYLDSKNLSTFFVILSQFLIFLSFFNIYVSILFKTLLDSSIIILLYNNTIFTFYHYTSTYFLGFASLFIEH